MSGGSRSFTRRLTGETKDPETIIYETKLNVMRNALSSETYVLTNLLSRLASANRQVRDFTDDLLEAAIRETIACFPGVSDVHRRSRAVHGAGSGVYSAGDGAGEAAES